MIILYFLLIPTIYIIIKIFINFIVFRFGKLSYDGFNAFGFAYDEKKDVFYSVLNAWQKDFGYCHFYDVCAPIFRMIIDTEPIKFFYNNKNYLIVFWKGQYGITTGGEIGVYSTKQRNVDKYTLYIPDDVLDISFTLYKNNEKLEEINAKHWWLAMFKIGMFSKPKELTMDISITFPNYDMLKAFIDAFKKKGYKPNQFFVINNTFYFRYKKPRTRKVWTRSFLLDAIRQYYNKKNVKLYNSYLDDIVDDNEIDDSATNNNSVLLLQNLLPDVVKNDNNNNIKIITYNSKNNALVLNDKVYVSKQKNKL